VLIRSVCNISVIIKLTLILLRVALHRKIMEFTNYGAVYTQPSVVWGDDFLGAASPVPTRACDASLRS
jgi:hypothetical protein